MNTQTFQEQDTKTQHRDSKSQRHKGFLKSGFLLVRGVFLKERDPSGQAGFFVPSWLCVLCAIRSRYFPVGGMQEPGMLVSEEQSLGFLTDLGYAQLLLIQIVPLGILIQKSRFFKKISTLF